MIKRILSILLCALLLGGGTNITVVVIQPDLAVAAGAGADYVPVVIHFKWGASDIGGRTTRFALFDKNENLVTNGATEKITCAGTSQEDTGTFTDAAAMVAGETYYVGNSCDTSNFIERQSGGGVMYDDDSHSDINTVPTNIDHNTWNADDPFTFTIKNAGGDTLLSNGTYGNGETGFDEGWQSYEAGYTCATL